LCSIAGVIGTAPVPPPLVAFITITISVIASAASAMSRCRFITII
jgi:hypothetical protein